MEPIAQSVWRLEFARKAAISRELEERLRDDKHLKDKRQKEKSEDLRETAELAAVIEVLASETQIAEFSVKLDRYDAATVDALMANGEDLKVVREKIDRMLLEAHTLPDGRRVFKTRDGSQVFDETGVEVKAEEVSPLEIDDRDPRWEDFVEADAQQKALLEERDNLIDFQEKLDDAREKLKDPALTESDLDALEAELGEAAPERVTASLDASFKPELANSQNEPDFTEGLSVPEHDNRSVYRNAGPGTGPV